MGGAGTWHLGLHRPDRWCVIGPGAGFTTTHGYIKDLPEKLGWPLGAMPAHLRRRRLRRERLQRAGRRLRRRQGRPAPGRQEHRGAPQANESVSQDCKFSSLPAWSISSRPSGSRRPRQRMRHYVEKGRAEYPAACPLRHLHAEIRRPATGSISWAWNKHYEKAVVDAEKTEDGFKVTTTNVACAPPARCPRRTCVDMTVHIDEQELTARPWGSKGGESTTSICTKRDGKWTETCRKSSRWRSCRSLRKNQRIARADRRRLHRAVPVRTRHRPAVVTRPWTSTPRPV